jgi:uncharacterized membrane protein YuzA (DUF378 family)
MKGLPMLTMILVVVGTVNLGLVGLGGFLGSDLNVLGMLLGSWPVVVNLVNLLIGLSGIMLGYVHFTGKCTMKG